MACPTKVEPEDILLRLRLRLRLGPCVRVVMFQLSNLSLNNLGGTRRPEQKVPASTSASISVGHTVPEQKVPPQKPSLSLKLNLNLSGTRSSRTEGPSLNLSQPSLNLSLNLNLSGTRCSRTECPNINLTLNLGGTRRPEQKIPASTSVLASVVILNTLQFSETYPLQ